MLSTHWDEDSFGVRRRAPIDRGSAPIAANEQDALLSNGKPAAASSFPVGAAIALAVIALATVAALVLGAYATHQVVPGGPIADALDDKQDMLVMDSVIRVGPGRTYKTVTEVIALYKQHHIGDLEIVVDPGTYEESYDLSGLASYSTQFKATGNRSVTKGLKIRGSELRPIDGVSYIDDHPAIDLANFVGEAGHTLTTDAAGVGPFTVFISPDLLEAGGDLAYPFTAEIVKAEPFDACTPLTNSLTGKIGLAIRGNCAFTVKAQNMADAGAVTQIIYNSNPGIIFLGGTEVMGGGPTFAMSGEDGPALDTAVQAGTVSGTLTPPSSAWQYSLGLPQGLVDITHPGGNLAQVQVDVNPAPASMDLAGEPGENPDFNAAGVAPGDKIVFVCPDSDPTRFLFGFAPINENQYFHEEATVASVSGNVITLTSPLTYDCSVPDSSMTFAPRVHVTGIADSTGLPAPLMSINGGGVGVRGMYFSPPSSASFRSGADDMITVSGSHLEMSNCVVYDRTETFDSVLIYQSQFSNAVSGSVNEDGLNGAIGACNAIINSRFTTSGASLDIAGLSLLGSRQDSALISEGTTGEINTLQVIWSEELTIYNNLGINVVEASTIDINYLNIARHPYAAVYAGDGSTISINDHVYARRNAQYAFGGGLIEWATVFAARRGSDLSIVGFNGDDNDGHDVFIVEGSRAAISGSYVSTNRRKGGPAFISTGPNTVDTATIASTPGNVIRYTNSTFVDNNYLTGVVVGGSPLDLTLDPSEQIETFDFPGQYRFVGRSYKFIFEDAVPHTITLLGGATFQGPGIPAGSDVITLNAGAPTMAPSSDHTCITLDVISPTEVVICSGADLVTPSIAPAIRRSAEAKPKRMTMPPGAHRPHTDTLGKRHDSKKPAM
jgi:hypothetical protein